MIKKFSLLIANYEMRLTKYALRIENILLILLALSVCISEPLSRNIIRIIFVTVAVKFFVGKDIIVELFKRYKFFMLTISAFAWWMIISSIYGGDLVTDDDSNVYWFFFSHNMILFIPLILMIRRQNKSEKLLIATGISLLIDDIFIAYQIFNGVEFPITFLNDSPLQNAILYVILLPMFLILTLDESTDRLKKYFYGATFFVSWAAFIFLYTKPAQLILIAIFLLILIERFGAWKKFLAVALTAGIFFALMPIELNFVATLKEIFAERILVWQGAANMIKDNPIMGVGLGNYFEQYIGVYGVPAAQIIDVPHALNTYLQLWAETGIFGVGLFCALFGGILLWARQRFGNLYGKILFFSTLALTLYSATDFIFESYSAMRLYWFLFGVCIASLDR